MPDTTATISCGVCGKQYSWKPQYAGRTLRCSCGSSLATPANASVPGTMLRQSHDVIIPTASTPAEDEFDRIVASAEYDVAANPPAVAKPAEVAKPARDKVVVFVPGKKAGLGSAEDYLPQEPRKRAEFPAPSKWREYYVPIGMIAAGVIGSCVLSGTLEFTSFFYAIIFVIVECLINVIAAYVGITSASKLLDLGLGDMQSALLKMAAIGLVSGTATDSLVTHSFWMSLTCSMVLNTAAMSCLFEVEIQEITMGAGIVWICKLLSLLMVMGVNTSCGGTLFRNVW